MVGSKNYILTKLFLGTAVSKVIALLKGLKIETASDEKQLAQVYKFRYEVYLAENYIRPNSSGEFVDKYDRNCINIFVEDTKAKKIIATARVIFNSSEGFPTERLFNIPKESKDLDKIAEISRFAINKNYRGRGGVVFLLMVKQIYLELKERGIEEVYSNMPEKLASHFSKFGFRFKQLEEKTPTEENITERNLIGGYFSKKVLLPYKLSLSKAEREIGINN